jgi:carnitine-CoA ligase
MDASANRPANARGNLGVLPGDHVVVMLPNSVEFLHAWFGISRLGAVFVPINTAYKGPLLEHVINNAAARVMLIERAYFPLVKASTIQLPQLDIVIIVDTTYAVTNLSAFQPFSTRSFSRLLNLPATPMRMPVS